MGDVGRRREERPGLLLRDRVGRGQAQAARVLQRDEDAGHGPRGARPGLRVLGLGQLPRVHRDDLRARHGFGRVLRGASLPLSEGFELGDDGYVLRTPSLNQ